MTLICGRHLLAFLLMLSMAQTATGLWWRDLLFRDYLRPALAGLIGYALDAEVRLGEARLTASRLQLSDLNIDKPDAFNIAVADADIHFTLAGLWRRQIEAIRLRQPQVELRGLVDPTAEATTEFPEHPPFEVALLRIIDGSVALTLEDQRRELHDLQVDLRGTRHPRFEASARLGAQPGLPIALAGEGSWDQRPALVLSRVDWNGAPLLDAPLRFQLDNAGATVAGSAHLPLLNRAEMERVAAILALPVKLPADVDFAANNPEVSLSIHPAGLDVQLAIPSTSVRRGDRTLGFEALRLALRQTEDGAWTGEGRFTLEQRAHSTFTARYAEQTVTGEFDCIVADIGALLGQFAPELRRDLTGGGVLDGKFTHHAEKTSIQANFTGRPAPDRPADYRLDIAPLQMWLSADIAADKLKGEARVLLAQRPLLSLAGTPEQLRLRLEPVSLAELAQVTSPGQLPAALLALQGFSGTGELGMDQNGFWRGQLDLKATELRTSGVEATALFASSEFQQHPQGLDLNDLRFAGRIALPEIGHGKLSGRASATLSRDAVDVQLASLTVDNAEFLSRDGLSGLTGGQLQGSGAVRGKPGESRLDFDLAARLGVAEVLHGALYANLAGHEALLNLAGEADPAAKTLTARRLTLEIPELVSARLTGGATPETVELGGALTTGELGAAFDRYLRPILNDSTSELKDLRLAGVLAAEFTLRKTAENLAIDGKLQSRNLGLALASADLEIAGGNGLLPLAYHSGPPSPRANDDVRSGQLEFATFRLGPLRLEPAPITLLGATNRLTIAEFPDWRIAGGGLRIANLNVAIDDGRPTVSARLRLNDIDLRQLTEELEWVAMTGQVNADLGEIRYADQTLTSAGQATVDVFGGSLVISNISLRDPASRYRTLHGDIDFSGIDLHQLTRTFEFGEMNGILDGHIHNLRLFGATPSHFDAELATRDDGHRDISVKALNNLTILSQGGLSGALSHGIYRFIDFYRYQKLGVRCSLNNDIFHLRGTARDDSNEYLVYGGLLPPKIDIIAPERDISFKEMLKRLGRLDSLHLR